MTRARHLYLVDGPLVDTQCLRHAMVERMANDLIRHKQAASREAAAMRTLRDCGYAMADIVMLIDDVRNLAFQEIVGPAMSEPPRPFYGAECPSYPACNGGCGLGCTHEIETRKRADGEAGMAWWNSLSDDDRRVWAIKAGSGRAADAWEVYKRRTAAQT